MISVSPGAKLLPLVAVFSLLRPYFQIDGACIIRDGNGIDLAPVPLISVKNTSPQTVTLPASAPTSRSAVRPSAGTYAHSPAWRARPPGQSLHLLRQAPRFLALNWRAGGAFFKMCSSTASAEIAVSHTNAPAAALRCARQSAPPVSRQIPSASAAAHHSARAR